jgi:hypothetical protein
MSTGSAIRWAPLIALATAQFPVEWRADETGGASQLSSI